MQRSCVPCLFVLVALALTAPVLAQDAPPTEGLRTDNVYVRGTDRGRVYIVYDLVGAADVADFEIRAAVSLDGGATFVPLRAVIGDVGTDVVPGPEREIIWTALEDFPEGVGDADLVFQVTVVLERPPNRTWLYVLGGAIVAGLGTTVALLVGGDDDPGAITGGTPNIPPPVGRPTN